MKTYKFVYLVEASDEGEAESKLYDLDLATILDNIVCEGEVENE